MNEDTTGSPTGESTTVTLSLTIKVLAQSLSLRSHKRPSSLQWKTMKGPRCAPRDPTLDPTLDPLVVASAGDIVSVYRKSHLFDVELPEKGVCLKESAFTVPGPGLVSPVQTPIGKVSF